mgnify:FL=1
MLTNSLAATDEPLVHIGYQRYRVPMLRLGVELHELSPVRAGRSKRLGAIFSRSIGRLHAKTAVIDRRQVFIGSMNFDPRSEKHNTEMGLFVDSPQLAREMLRLMDLDKLQASYQVVLKPDGSLRWVAMDKLMATYGTVRDADGSERLQTVDDDDEPVELTEEPDADGFTQFLLRLLTPLAPVELL